MVWGKIKTYAILALSVLVAALAFLARLFGSRSKRLEYEAACQRAKYEHIKEVMHKDVEIEREHDKRTEELARDVEEKRTSDELSDPNRW